MDVADNYFSEEYIEANQHSLGWNSISSYQKLSEDFIRRFSHKINWYCLFEYNASVSNEIKDKFRWKYDKKYQPHTQAYYYDGTIVNGYEKDGVFFFSNGDCDLVENLKLVEHPPQVRRSAQLNNYDYKDALTWATFMTSCDLQSVRAAYPTFTQYDYETIRKYVSKKRIDILEKIRQKYAK